MGADACLHVFDDRAYRDDVVPALVRLMRDGTMPDWVANIDGPLDFEPDTLHRVDLEQCAFLDGDLAWTGTPMTTHFAMSNEHLCFLFCEVVRARCVGEHRFLARSIDVRYVDPALDACGVPADALARRLLVQLDQRGHVLGDTLGGSREGIHGWLDARETEALAAALAPLALPDSGDDQAEFRAVVLARIREVCALAVAQGRGVLWGNDL